MVARMDVPGRWAGGFRAWDEHGDLPGDRSRRRRRAGCSGVPAEVLRELVDRVVPVRRAPDRAASTTRRARSSRPRGSATRWSRWARWRPGWPTRSTTRPPRPRRAVDALGQSHRDACSRRWRRLARRRDHGRPVRRPRRAAPRDRPQAPAASRPARRSPTARSELAGWLARHGVGRAWATRAAAGRRPGSTSRGASGADVAVGDRALEPGAGVGGEHDRRRDAARRGEGVDAADLRARRGGPLLLPDGPGVAAADRRHATGSRARW